jgi:Ran GTPase-activating protein (RanGAP) involved in mRNA processing and transport
MLHKYSSNYYSTERDLSCYSLLEREESKHDGTFNNSLGVGFEDSSIEGQDSFEQNVESSWSYVGDEAIADIHTSNSNSHPKSKSTFSKDESNNLNSYEDISGVLNKSLTNMSNELKDSSTISNISYTSRHNFDLNGKSIDTKILPPSPTSPRTTFIGGCIREGINPLSRIIIRKKLSSVLDLENFNLGDVTGKILAECIHELPFVDSINLGANNLTDFSLKHLLNSMMKMETLTNLNISRNKIDGSSSTALAKWCSSPSCTIKVLTLQHADVDDDECHDFVGGLYTNSKIRELDLSHNFIGQKEGMKGVVTGGSALAEYLKSNKCGLTTLKVAWNSIRLDSACELSRALSINNTLTFLDLSYNGMGSAAGEALGDSIAYNKALKTLIIKNNNLNGCSCFTICVGVQENYAMKYLCMDENPIGELGAKALLQIPVMCGTRVSISAASCNTGLRGDPRANSFDYSFPCREYELKMENEFDRAVAMSILQIVASHSSYIFQSIYYELPGNSSKRLKLVQAISKEKENYFDENQKAIVLGLKKMLDASSSVEAGNIKLVFSYFIFILF